MIRHIPGNICEVVRRRIGSAVSVFLLVRWQADKPQNEKLWQLAKETALIMLRDPADDPTGGALYFHSADMPIP